MIPSNWDFDLRGSRHTFLSVEYWRGGGRPLRITALHLNRLRTHRQGLIEVVEDGDLDGEDLASLDGGREGQVREEGREGGDGCPLGQSHALLRVGAHGLAHPLGDGVGELEVLLANSACPGTV